MFPKEYDPPTEYQPEQKSQRAATLAKASSADIPSKGVVC
jgi:hypothetical protein